MYILHKVYLLCTRFLFQYTPVCAHTADNSDYMLSSRTIQFTPDSPGSVELTLTADGVASEAAEAVQLMLTPQQGTTVPDGLGTFSNTLLTVTIVDADTGELCLPV